MENNILKDLTNVMLHGYKDHDKNIMYLKLDEHFQTAIIVYENDISEGFINYSLDYKELQKIFLMYRGQVNKEFQPSGNGNFMTVAEFITEDYSGDFIKEFEIVELYEGKCENGNLISGTYSTSTNLNDINSPIMNTNLYNFYINDILGAEENPGKKLISTSISYKGGFNSQRLFEGTDCELIIDYNIDWIRQYEVEKGQMSFKGAFKDGSIIKGEYIGPYFGFDVVYDKKVHYSGQFSNNVFNGYGILKYNIDGGFQYHDRITCKYSGPFSNGTKHGEKGLEILHDTENNVEIKLKNCIFKNHLLLNAQSVSYESKENSLFGFDEKNIITRNLKFEGDFNTPTGDILLPDDLSTMLGKGILTITDNTYSSKLYKNYGDNINGTFRYLYGTVILDGIFNCLDERTNKISYEKWRCGYLIEQVNELEDLTTFEFNMVTNKIFDELLDNGKDAMKRLLPSVVATKVFETNLFMLYIFIGFLGTFMKSSKDLFLKDISQNKKKVLMNSIQASVNSINGEIKELELQTNLFKELSNYNSQAAQYRGGMRWKIYSDIQILEKIRFDINKSKTIFLKTQENLLEALELLQNNKKFITNNLLISVDNLEREYENLKVVFEEINNYDTRTLNEDAIIPINNALIIFNDSYIKLIEILRHSLIKLIDWLNNN